jgi:hypothetical protein
MSEQDPNNERPFEIDGVTPEEQDRYGQWIIDHPEPEPVKERREAQHEIADLENLIAAFETTHSIEELYAVIDLTTEQALQLETRKLAKKDLDVILKRLDVLSEETNITPEKYSELHAKYKYFSRAIGIIKNNKVDHTR